MRLFTFSYMLTTACMLFSSRISVGLGLYNVRWLVVTHMYLFYFLLSLSLSRL